MNLENPMQAIKIEKVVLSGGATADSLQKERKLLEILTKRKAQIIASRKRIPDFGVRPGLEVGTRVTLRGKSGIEMLKRLLGAIDNQLKRKQIADTHFSFGIEEYIEIPGIEYQRDIGIRGFNVSVVFARKGLRIQRKKIKSGHVPHRQHATQEEIIKFMEDVFKTKIE
ncbi:50S ribosomal protein L5 [Candidatus Pacearchaeota archaeon]|nr:50S ribosomal protein L5 [Candidatus Pacearchaeota archaeon]